METEAWVATVASLRLISPGVVTDDVTFRKMMTFFN